MACHSDVTAGQGADRRSTRAKARKQLKVIMNDLKKYQKTKETNTNIEVYSDEAYHFGEGGGGANLGEFPKYPSWNSNDNPQMAELC